VRGAGAMVRMRGWWWWGVAFANARREREFGLNSRNRAVVTRFRVHCAKWRRGMVWRGGVVVCMRWRRSWGCAFVNARQRGGFGPKSETELLWLGLRRAVRNSDGGWCIEVVWRCVRGGGGGGGAVCSRNGRQAGRGFGPKPETRNRAVVARFRARRVKRRRGMVRRGGAMVCTRWWWWWGCAFAKREVRSGQAKKNRNRAAVARFRAAVGCKRWRGELWGYIPPSRAKLK
jgi:hypothetical protein